MRVCDHRADHRGSPPSILILGLDITESQPFRDFRAAYIIEEIFDRIAERSRNPEKAAPVWEPL